MNSKGTFDVRNGSLLHYTEATTFTVKNHGSDLVDDIMDAYQAKQSATIPGYVEKIGAFAFHNCNHISELIIEKGVKAVEKNAFCGIRTLSSVWIPNSIQHLPVEAFPRDHLVTLHIQYPAGLLRLLLLSRWNLNGIPDVYIGSALALKMAYEHQSQFHLIIHVGRINDFEFARCPFPVEVHLEGSTYPVKNAFEGSLVNRVFIGEKVKLLGDLLFGFTYEWNGPAIEHIDVAENNATYFSKEGVLYEKTGRRLLRCPHEKRGAYVVPDGTTVVAGAFDGCYLLDSLYIPSHVQLECNALAGMSIDSKVVFV